MKQLDLKHLIYHVLIALYFIWLPVFALLQWMAVNATVFQSDFLLGKILLLWISLNIVIGTSLYFVIRLFGKQSVLYKVVTYSYFTVALLSIVVVFLIVNCI